MKRIILASKSPRRKQIMEMLKLPFDVEVADIEERINYQNDLRKEIENLSFLKALNVFNKHNDAVVIGADTIVVINNEVLGKPKDEEDAKRMLSLLKNNMHYVITGVSIISKEKSESFVSISEVYFNDISDNEIDEYIKTKEPMDKAGAYGIQGLGAKFINKINGDFYSIMGLPINELYKRLKEYL